MQRVRIRGENHSRTGLTIVDLLVAITIIGILLALVLPAVMHARESARGVQCQGNLRNLALAIGGSCDLKSRYPAASYQHRNIDVGTYRSWVIEILPWIDQNKVYQSWDLSRFNWESPNDQLGKQSFALLACPSDVSAIPGNPNLSYVVNGGFGWSGSHSAAATWRDGAPQLVDYNGNGLLGIDDPAVDGVGTDQSLYIKTSLFFLGIWPDGPDLVRLSHSTSSVSDGLSNTLMLGENVKAGYDPSRLAAMGWAASSPWRTCFFVSNVCDDLRCQPGHVDYSRANSKSAPPYAKEALNASLTQPEGTPWPSSLHGPGVNFAFCDGRVKFISDSIDGAVYAALITPQGGRIRGPLHQVFPAESDY